LVFSEVQVQPVVPPPAIEKAFLRIAAKKLFRNNRPTFRIMALKNTHLIEQRDEQLVLRHRRGYVVRAPRIRDNRRRAAARSAARRRLQFEQDKILEAGAQKTPRCRKPRHAATDDYHADALPTVFRRHGTQTIAQAMSD